MNHDRRPSPGRHHRCGVEPVAATVGADHARHGGRGPVSTGCNEAGRAHLRRRRSRHLPSTTAAQAANPAPIDGGWPRLANLPSGGTILIYQPQVASWDKQAHLVAFSAVSHRAKAVDKPAIGTIKLEADTKVALEDRLVSFQQMKITEANFQTLPKEQVREVDYRDRSRDSG